MGSRWVHGEQHLPRYRERSRHRSAQLPRRLCRTISKSCSWPLRVLSLGLRNAILTLSRPKAREGRPLRLDSEQFRSAPRTCLPFCDRLSVRQTRPAAAPGGWGGSLMSDLRRRDFITLLGGAAAAWPLAAQAQQPVPAIGLLAVAAPDANAVRLRAFREGLRTVGYVEGQNVKIEYRWAEAHTGRLPELAGELVRDGVTVLVAAGGIASAVAAKAATREIPVVSGAGADPVEVGLVASLNRPGGNVTGVTSLNQEVAPKRLELMHELLPSVNSMALLVNPAVPANAEPVSRSSQ